MTNRAIFCVDISGSVKLRIEQGEQRAVQMIVARIQEIEITLKKSDPTLKRAQAIQGDGLWFIGTDVFALFQAAVKSAGEWRSWPEGVTARCSLGYGDFVSVQDGEHMTHSGQPVDLTHRLLDKCPEGRLVVTDAASESIKAKGYGHMLVRLNEDVPGLGYTTWYEADGKFIPTEGSRPAAEPKVYPPLPLAQGGAMPGSQPKEERVKLWRVQVGWFAISNATAFLLGLLLGLYLGGQFS